MSHGDIKPWSQLDDEQEERSALAGRDRSSLSSSYPDEIGPAARPSRISLAGKISLLRITPHWALPPLAIAALLALWQAIRLLSGPEGASAGPLLAICALVAAGGAVVLISLYARRTVMAGLRRAVSGDVRQLPRELKDLPLASELRPLYQAIEHHAANVERQAIALADQHQQLALELSLTETNRRQVEAIIDSLPEAILATDAFGQLLLANPAAETVFGVARATALRKPVAETIKDQKVVRIIQQAGEADVRAANRSLEHEMGSQAYLLRLSPLVLGAAEDQTPLAHGVVVLCRNITKEREAARNKSEFVAQAAHELRTPLSSIRAYVEMLVDDEAEDEKTRKEYYNIIQTSADRLGRMIDNVLNISRIEAGTVRINREPVAVSMIVKDAADVARPQAEEKGITLTEELTPVVYRVMADRDMIYQAVLNLLSNAIKYTPAGGKVHVRMAPHEENRLIRIEVSDTGVGIPEADLPRVFEKFFRVEANKEMAKGTGLGLNLVKHIVETIHEGKVTLASKVGKGSTFGMNLPLMP